MTAGLDAETAAELAKRVISGDVKGIIGTAPEALRADIAQIGSAAFVHGFAAALLLAAAIAAVMALLTFALVRRAETMPLTVESNPLPTTVKRRAGPGEPTTTADGVGLAE
jgi:hypothetical protein